MSKEALGMVETRGLTAAIEAADSMVKSSVVREERKNGTISSIPSAHSAHANNVQNRCKVDANPKFPCINSS